LTRDLKTKAAATKAIDFTVKAQHAGGGWRYQPGQKGDLSATSWQYMALHSARRAGLSVPDKVFIKTGKFVDSVSVGKHGGFYSYMPGGRTTRTMVATGMCLRQLDGRSSTDASTIEGAEFLKARMPTKHAVDFYGDFFVTMALHEHQGQIWQDWSKHLKDAYLPLQQTSGKDKGSWHAQGAHMQVGGRVMTTSFAVLNLAVYYRHLPMHRLRTEGAKDGVFKQIDKEN
jgi:hypothetical protein